MTRVQWCRDHIDEVKENCGLSERTIQEVNQASDFVEANREISRLPTTVILTVIRIKDTEIREKILLSVKNSLESNKHPISGLYNQEITAKDIKNMVAVLSPKREETPKKTIAPSTPSEKPSGPKEVDPATVASIAGVPIMDVKPINTTADLDAYLKEVYQGSRPSDKTGPFTPASEIPKGLVDLNAPDTRTKDYPDILVIKSPPNPAQAPPVLPEFITITITRGQARALDNAIKRGDVKADEKAGKDAWQVAAARAFETGCNIMENGGV